MSRSRVQKWQRWLRRVNDEVSGLFLNREVWRAIAKTIDGNPAIPRSIGLNFIATNYAISQAVTVRRLAEPNLRVVSFATLLAEIADYPDALTARNTLPAGNHRDHVAWEHHFAGGVTGGHVDPAVVGADLLALESKVAPIKGSVDRWLTSTSGR